MNGPLAYSKDAYRVATEPSNDTRMVELVGGEGILTTPWGELVVRENFWCVL
jgi:hypothetical protein